ncbi:hypothetical protein [Microvirga pakistanensis]|uniref:hypothetical protein n=1 Tax=Microvirga pakistanensis TaxID=1682650 RepID=UPI00106D5636|nr:hypothetical protein [Microvirga pakistanensis]
MASFVAHPVEDDLERRPPTERLYLFDGALLTQEHFRAEQLYHRGQASRLGLHLHGAGTIAGLDVRYAPTSGPDVEVQVSPGLALDRLGRIVELPYLSCLDLGLWVGQQANDILDAARLTAGTRAPGTDPIRDDPGTGDPIQIPSDHVVVDVYLSFHACARNPEPAFATANADTIDGVQPSRVLDTGHLRMIVRPSGDNRIPSSLPASQLPAPVTLENLRDYKRLVAWGLVQPSANPFSMPAGGTISEHVTAGNYQDGSEVLLARLTIPLDLSGAAPAFDDTIDLDQAPYRPNQDIRPYSYSADELALIAANIRS